MYALTTETANQLCKDLEDLTAILELLAASNSLTPNAIAAFGNCAKSCEKYLEACHKKGVTNE